MFPNYKVVVKLLTLVFLIFPIIINTKTIPEGYYHSDVIVTNWPTTASAASSLKNVNNGGDVKSTEERQPGWVREQLLKFGQLASKIGNAMGKHTSKIATALDKICEVIKTVIPLLAAVCHVGEFGFCSAADDAPIKLSEAMNMDTLDLSSLDR